MIDLTFGIYLATQLLDFYTTYVIVGKQGGRERNGWLARLIERVGLVPALAFAKTLGVGAGAYLWYFQQIEMLVVLTLIYVWQVYQNGIRIK